MSNGETRGAWGSKIGFILAAAGSAIGLGNIWKFPYICGENGGGLFVLIYLACIFFVGLPILMAEIMVGRAAQKQPVAAFHALSGKGTAWAAAGWIGIVAGFVILSYYVVVAGWAADYALKSIANFGDPIAKEATLEGSKYRANASDAEMRSLVTEARVKRVVRKTIQDIRAGVGSEEWTAYRRFQTAIEASGLPAPQARERLFEDEELKAAVLACEPLATQINEAEEKARAAVTSEVAALEPKALRDEAEQEVRRNAIGDRVTSAFMGILADGWWSTFWAALFLLITILIVSGGVSGGIERTCKLLMPLLFILICVMVVYGMFTRGFGDAVSFVFKPDPSRLTKDGVLEALGHAFFTLSLGMGAMITYGSYQKSKGGLATQSILIAGLDTLIAIMACLMMFPILFSYGQEPGAGPGLVFISMPLAFAELGSGGMLLSILFFGLLVFAALTSAISLLEVVASYFIDVLGWSRRRAAWIVGGAIFLFSLPSAFAADEGGLFAGWEASYGKNFFDTVDYFASNWLLPLGGLLISLYAGWIMPQKMRDLELEGLGALGVKLWLYAVKFAAPALVLLVLAKKIGLL